MEDQCWSYYYHEEGIEELKHALLYTTLELETTILSAQEEIARKESELAHLKDLLTTTFRERNEAQAKCQRLMLEKLLLQQLEIAPKLGTTRNEDDQERVKDFNEENIIASPPNEAPIPPPPPPPPPLPEQQPIEKLAAKRALPEKGKLLKAVMEAGPLLQTLLLAGPLPQWQHPPPQLNSIEIPPITLSSPTPPPTYHRDSSIRNDSFSGNKRDPVHREVSDCSLNTKYQKVSTFSIAC